MNKNKLVKLIRWVILGIITIAVTISSYLHITLGGSKSASIHALCPFGGLESLYQFFDTGSLLSKIFTGTMVLFFITLVLAIIFRRSFCGLLCPFGAIQEFFAKIGQKIFRKKFIIPTFLDKPLRYLKYIILVVTVFYAWRTAGLWMSPYDPWAAYSHLSEGILNVWAESAIGLILLAVTIIGSIIYDRFFCKYLCPMGAFYGIISKISPYKVVRNKDLCIDCGKCNKVCPVNIDVEHLTEIKTAECIDCQLCVLECPKEGALCNKIAGRKISPFVTIAIVVLLFFGSIFIFQATGNFNLKPGQLKAGETMPFSDMKGYMTIKEAAELTKIELVEFYKKLGIPESVPADTMMKNISELVPGFDFHAVKEEN